VRAYSSIFSQLLKLFPRGEFDALVGRHQAERGAKGFRCWDQFVAMMFCHFAKAQSLREISDGLRTAEGKLSHLGACAPARSTLSYANAHRPWELFRDVAETLMVKCRELSPKHRFNFKNKLFSIDATTIVLCCLMFDWARYKRAKGGIKVHLVLDHDGYLPTFAIIREAKQWDSTVAREMSFPKGAIVVCDRAYNDFDWFYQLEKQEVFFIVRMKKGTKYEVVEEHPVAAGSVVKSDQTIRLTKNVEAGRDHDLRRIEISTITREGEELVFLTNNFELSAELIAEVYRDRFQIEKVFKEIKQHLRIKTFVGTSPNAVHIQIWTALTALLILRYLRFQGKVAWSMSNLVAMLRFSLFAYRDLLSWLANPFESPPEASQLALDLG
jgi:hypothetical protein